MDAQNTLAPGDGKQKRKTLLLSPLRFFKSPASNKINPLSPVDHHEEKTETTKATKKRKSGTFTTDNFNVKDFTDDEILQCFKSFDLDSNGFLCAAEIKQCFKKLGEKVTDEEIDEMMKMCDKNGDGQIEFDEFQGMVYTEAGIKREFKSTAVRQPGATKSSLMNAQTLRMGRNKQERFKRLLQALDFETKSMKDIHNNFMLMNPKDGLIDFADFCACSKLAVNEESTALFQLFQNECGDDKTKKIDYRFFLISLVGVLAPNLEMKIKYTFEIFDIDGNGLIDTDELTAVVAATQLLSGRQLTERVEKIMRLADSNGNGELDYDEFAVCCRRYSSLIFTALR